MMNIVLIILGQVIYTWAGSIDVLHMIIAADEIIVEDSRYKVLRSELNFDASEYQITVEYVGHKY